MYLSHRISFQFKSVGVVDKAIEDRIGDGGVGDTVMPIGNRDLSGH